MTIPDDGVAAVRADVASDWTGMERIIKAAVDRGASDVHIKAGDVVRARIDGVLTALTKQPLTPDQTRAIALRLIANADERQHLDTLTDLDVAYSLPGVGRFRVSILRQRSSLMIVMRIIAMEVPSLERLALPPVLARIAEAERGLVLVTGSSGSGKTSTMAALVDHMNQRLTRHIVTLENPIEYLHRDARSSITQREVGVDTQSFAVGLRAALRQDPDVIVIDELRDAGMVESALDAVEGGDVVISSLRSLDAPTAFARLIGMFPLEEQPRIRPRLARALSAIISQRLLPRADGSGRVAALEVLLATPLVRELLLDDANLGGLRDVIERESQSAGMQSLDQHLTALVTAGTITLETALSAATRPAELEARARTLAVVAAITASASPVLAE